MKNRVKDFIKKALRNFYVQWMAARLASLYIKIVYHTTRWQTFGVEYREAYIHPPRPFIICFWHGRLGMIACQSRFYPHRCRMLISGNRDGILIGRTMEFFNIGMIEGSSSRGGSKALRELLRYLKSGGFVGMTPDGPRGPREEVSDGIITAAILAGVDIVPVTFATSHAHVLNTWDRFIVPLPFGRGVFIYGKPISPSKSQEESNKDFYRNALKNELDRITKEADKLC